MTSQRERFGWIMLALLCAAAIACRFLVGRDQSGQWTFGWPASDATEWRLGALISGLLGGAALSISGLLLQTLLRNPLASPFILGLSAGSQACVAGFYWIAAIGGPWLLMGGGVIPATAGALLALGVTLYFGRGKGGGIDPISLVLSGVIVGTVAAAIASLIEWMLPPEMRPALTGWALGRVPEVPPLSVSLVTGVAVGAGVFLGYRQGSMLDAMGLSDDESASIGVPVARVRLALVLGSSLLAAAATALCGPLAFVGLIGPHMARSCVGPRHRVAVLASAIAGSALLVAADAVRHFSPASTGRLPVGVICALAGGPFFLLLLRRGAARAWMR
ncbi:MAG: iron ABC transporter permease [Planctomycetes bacterium]|nr:iron ABC transporter permease [Planctomycetota bacterium]